MRFSVLIWIGLFRGRPVFLPHSLNGCHDFRPTGNRPPAAGLEGSNCSYSSAPSIGAADTSFQV